MPKVSVIVPNYNYAPYLPQRMRTILAQTLDDVEVIYLDDGSTDESPEVVAEFAGDPRVCVLRNETNSGNPFVQWNRGLRLCRGQYVWIAEADDYADPRLLERLTGVLDAHPRVDVAYCQSWLVDEHGTVLGTNAPYTAALDAERWTRDYIGDGREECRRWLVLMNTIPNASAVVFRRAAAEHAGGADESYRLAGDWQFWAKLLTRGDVAFVHEPLNYYRRHPRTVRAVTERDGIFVEEWARVVAWITENVAFEPDELRRVRETFLRVWAAHRHEIPWSRHRRIYHWAKRLDPNVEWDVVRLGVGKLLRLPRRWRRPRAA